MFTAYIVSILFEKYCLRFSVIHVSLDPDMSEISAF